MHAPSRRSGRSRTWINGRIRTLYCKLHEIGHCHSVEAWRDGKLVGGLYGVRLGRAFFGESMFHRERDASKVALVHLVARLRAGGFALLDTQFVTSHLTSFGAIEVNKRHYNRLLERALEGEADFFALDPDPLPGAAALAAFARRKRLADRCRERVPAAPAAALAGAVAALVVAPRWLLPAAGAEHGRAVAPLRTLFAVRLLLWLRGTPPISTSGITCGGPCSPSCGGAGCSRHIDRRLFAVVQPDVIDRMLDRVQTWACGEHPARKDAANFTLQRDFADLDKGIGRRRFGRGTRIADARHHLQRAELHGFAKRDFERDDPAGDLVEARENRRLVRDLLCRRGATTSSPGWGVVFAGAGVPRGAGTPGGRLAAVRPLAGLRRAAVAAARSGRGAGRRALRRRPGRQAVGELLLLLECGCSCCCGWRPPGTLPAAAAADRRKSSRTAPRHQSEPGNSNALPAAAATSPAARCRFETTVIEAP